MLPLFAILSLAFIGATSATKSLCQPTGPSGLPMYNGKFCGTTTAYGYGGENPGGACGCYDSRSLALLKEPNVYNAAGSGAIFGYSQADDITGLWCGGGCGTCWKLTSTGQTVSGEGNVTTAPKGQSITVVISNSCPSGGSPFWCPDPLRAETSAKYCTNQYGFPAHFDLFATIQANGQRLPPKGWDNPIVTFKQVTCPAALKQAAARCSCNGNKGKSYKITKACHVGMKKYPLVAVV